MSDHNRMRGARDALPPGRGIEVPEHQTAESKGYDRDAWDNLNRLIIWASVAFTIYAASRIGIPMLVADESVLGLVPDDVLTMIGLALALLLSGAILGIRNVLVGSIDSSRRQGG